MKRVTMQAWIDEQKCVGCGTCTHVCPVLAITPRSDRPIKRTKITPCTKSCPASNDIEGFIFLLNRQRYFEAWQLLLETNPFPEVTGRVCPHPCEENCNRKPYEGALCIAELERFIGDYAVANGFMLDRASRKSREKIAVVGSGPAGLSCAYFLSLEGYTVSIFESMSQPGGMMRYGIPSYQLPREVLDKGIERILTLGIELKTSVTAGKDFSLRDLRYEGYKAVFLATGAHLGKTIDIQGMDLQGVLIGIHLLKNVNSGDRVKVGNRVIVVGGGNVAINVARTCLRLGSKVVQIVCLEKRKEMPAHEWEIVDAMAEGVTIQNSWAPKRILGCNSSLKGIELKRCKRVFDEQSRFNPIYNGEETKTIMADTVVFAIGQRPDLTYTKDDKRIKIEANCRVEVNPNTLETGSSGVFAGGDLVIGCGTVIEAIASGREAAHGMDAFLCNTGIRLEQENRLEVVTLDQMNSDYLEAMERSRIEKLQPEHAVQGFDEIKLGMKESIARFESKRCLHCASPPNYDPEKCLECSNCEQRCSVRAIEMKQIADPFVVKADVSESDSERIASLCQKANLHPKSIVCFCTSTRAEEIAAAILQGARTPEEVSLKTGARTGCTVLCFQPIIRLLNAADVECIPPQVGDVWYKTIPTVWDLCETIRDQYKEQGYCLNNDLEFLSRFKKS